MSAEIQDRDGRKITTAKVMDGWIQFTKKGIRSFKKV